jgi:hypothetical protein
MSKILSSTWIRYLFIGIIAPFLIQYTFFYRFTPNYMINVFSEESFNDFYGQSVFRYRVLSTHLQLFVYHQLKSTKGIEKVTPHPKYQKRLPALDAKGNELFYLSYFVVHLFFAIVLAFALLLLFDFNPFYNLSLQQKIFLPLFVLLMVGFSQFVLTPYDIISYFLLVFTFWASLHYIRTGGVGWLLVLCGAIVISTLTKESVVLNISALAALFFSAYRWSVVFFKKIAPPVMAFLFTYLALKLSLSGNTDFTAGLKLHINFRAEPSSAMGILFSLFILYAFTHFSDNTQNKKLIRYFLLFSLPFLISIPLVGILIEFRLWMPVILMVLLLSLLNSAATMRLLENNHRVQEKAA